MVELAEIQAVYYMVAATGVLVAAIYYVLNMRASQKNMQTTLDSRQAQLFMNIYNQSQTSPAWNKAWRIFYFTNWKTPEEFTDMMWSGKPEYNEFNESFALISNFYEGVGVLVKEKLLDIRLVALLMSGYTSMFWEKIAPAVYYTREAKGFPQFASETEYLYVQLKDYMKKNPNIHNAS
jgi:hypothetical protein